MNPETTVDKPQLLQQSPLFAEFDLAELERLAQFTKTKQINAKEVLFYQGDPGQQMYVIVTGKVKISIMSEEGKEIILGSLGSGDIFGEIALFDGKQRTATVTAVEPSTFLLIERQNFIPFLEQHSKAAIKLLAALSARLRMADEIIGDTLFLNLPSRLAKKLLTLARGYGQQTRGGLRIGATRESINKQMRAWEEQGLIKMDKGYITITDSQELVLLI